MLSFSLPIVAVIISILFLKRPPYQASIVGVFTALAFQFDGLNKLEHVEPIFKDSSILFLSAASVIIPGLIVAISIQNTNINQRLSQWIESFALRKYEKIIFIVLGFAPLLESLTGFGISMIATVPILFAILSREQALKIALLGMVIMPWGTLGLATVIGASLSNIPVTSLGSVSALVSSLTFLGASLLALYIAKDFTTKSVLFALTCWLIFIGVLFGISLLISPEIAGVLAGFSVVLIGLMISFFRQKKFNSPQGIWPYASLLLLVVLQEIVSLSGITFAHTTIQGHSVQWNYITSPFLPLSIVAIICIYYLKPKSLLNALNQRSWKTLLTIMLFLLMSQIIVKTGSLSEFSQTIAALFPKEFLPLFVSVGGFISGYITGSNVGGNAIMMILTVPINDDIPILLSAIQNSAAGHGAMGSIPIIMLLAGIGNTSDKEQIMLIRFGFMTIVYAFVTVLLSGYILLLTL